jgi:hypothetical protein
MNIVLTPDDLAGFSQSTRTEILRRFADQMGSLPSSAVAPAPALSDWFAGLSVQHLEDITQKYIARWMEKLSPNVERGVRIIAEHGPVLDAHWLTDAGINLKQFQSAVTRRTRAISRDPEANLLVGKSFNGEGSPHGTYAVSPITHQSLRRFYNLPV